jgi:DNA-binding LacI/PurR family transcriptional regulator
VPAGPNGVGHRPTGKPTLEAVAAIAGVSRATASRVVNESPKVRPEARAAVERAIRKLGYVPNRAARSLVTRRTDSIALVVSEPDSRVFAEPYFAGIVRSISQSLSETDLQLVLVMAQTPAERKRLERYLRQGHVDGALLISVHGDDPLPDHVLQTGTPTVLGGRPIRPLDMSFVDVDNRGGARDAVRHLISRGRTRIATIAGPADMAVGVDRLDGYRDAMRQARLRAGRELTEHGDFSQDSGTAAMRALLARAPAIDAVFAASDLMAAGAMRALKAAGRKVPADVAIVGWDDSTTALYTEPAMTSVRQPIDLMGRQMTTLLIEEITNPAATRRAVILNTELVVRDTT